MTLGRCGGWGGCVYFLFKYGNPEKSPFFFLFLCVGDMWRVFVDCVCCWWLVYSLTWPESDWLDSLGGAAHLWCMRVIMALRINQLSTHRPFLKCHTTYCSHTDVKVVSSMQYA